MTARLLHNGRTMCSVGGTTTEGATHMLFELVKVSRVSDMHGETCGYCQVRPCVTNIYLDDVDGYGYMDHTCENMICIGKALDPTDTSGHHGDDTPLVEVSGALMPWESGYPAPLAPAADTVDAEFADAVATDDITALADLVLSGRL